MDIIDFHSHILPDVDDGSKSVEMSIELLRMEAEQGIHSVIATPHFYAKYDTPERFLKRRERAFQLLQEEVKKYEGLPQIKLGAEVYYFSGISHSEAISQLTIDGKRCILIEMPGVTWTDSMYRELEGIYTHLGLTPVIAHIDRYIKPLSAKKVLNRLAELPVMIQANAEFFLNRSTAKLAMRMMSNDQIQVIGSDCHNLKDRKPDLGDAVALIQKRLGDDVLARISQYQNDILENSM